MKRFFKYVRKLWCKIPSFAVIKYRIFTPSNKLKIRNIDSSYIDHDVRLFHANFSLFCDFIEKELGGMQGLLKQKKDLERVLLTSTTLEHTKDSLVEEIEIIETWIDLYSWYINTNWEDPVPLTKQHNEVASRITYDFVPVHEDSDLFKMVQKGTPDDLLKLQECRLEYRNNYDIFENICNEKLNILIAHRKHLWY